MHYVLGVDNKLIDSGGSKMFVSALLQPSRSVCVSPSAFSYFLTSAMALSKTMINFYFLLTKVTQTPTLRGQPVTYPRYSPRNLGKHHVLPRYLSDAYFDF